MKTITNILLFVIVLIPAACHEQTDSRMHLRTEVKSDSLTDNIVIRPVAFAFSALIGEGIEVTQAVTRRNKGGILELHINGFNRSQYTKRFQYRVEWLDGDGLLIQTKTSVWMRMSAMGKSPFSFKVVAPKPEAVNFRMDTRK
ncbi:MAG: YcfL family protein [Planctomycetes bacterium]|nr:YcfL family protein [Planctomycetota bacterium]MCK5473521.1 YcfL family protein [Planctomycetota bacterium]